jgi:hypothetical protein
MTADALSAGLVGFSTPPAAFYCVSSRPYFPGAVAVLNSLRMVGHREPLFVLDCGLDPVQRKLLTPHATLVAAPSGVEPTLFKARAPLAHPAEVMVLLDADMIVTRPLSDLIEKAAEGRIVAFETGRDRFFAEWGPLLGLGPIRRQRYLSSGFLCMARGVGTEVLRLVADLQARIDPDVLWWGSGRPSEPFCFGDQDVLNAVLSSRIAPDRIVALQNRLLSELPFEGLRVIDAARLRCAYADGLEPYLVHHILYKPWLDALYYTPYARLLTRLLFGSDVLLRLDRHHVPLRLRTGLLAGVTREATNARERVRWSVRNRLPPQLAARWGGERERKLAELQLMEPS